MVKYFPIATGKYPKISINFQSETVRCATETRDLQMLRWAVGVGVLADVKHPPESGNLAGSRSGSGENDHCS